MNKLKPMKVQQILLLNDEKMGVLQMKIPLTASSDSPAAAWALCDSPATLACVTPVHPCVVAITWALRAGWGCIRQRCSAWHGPLAPLLVSGFPSWSPWSHKKIEIHVHGKRQNGDSRRNGLPLKIKIYSSDTTILHKTIWAISVELLYICQSCLFM